MSKIKIGQKKESRMPKTKFVAISDTHNKHESIKVPKCDILFHAGDFSTMGKINETKLFLEWFNKQPATHKVFISGNHDFMDQNDPKLFKELLKEYPGITYLRDEAVTINGIKIWGRPWTPKFYEWAFMKEPGSDSMRSTLEIIPSDIDILLTHGPAYGILDLTVRNEKVGCKDLLEELDRIKPQILVCGHIHHSSGEKEVNSIRHINAAVLNDYYELSFKPKKFSIDNK